MQKKLTIFKDDCTLLGITNGSMATAIPIMLTGRALDYFYNRLNLARQNMTYEEIVNNIESHFETPEVRQEYLNEWNSIRFYSIINNNSNKSRTECFELMIDMLVKIQPGLNPHMRGEDTLREKILIVYEGIPECSLSLFRPSATLNGVCADMRNAISIKTKEIQAQPSAYHQQDEHHNEDQEEQYWTDRQYGGRRQQRGYGRGPYRGTYSTRGRHEIAIRELYRDQFKQRQIKKCYVCDKAGCWSNRHPLDERKALFDRYKSTVYSMRTDPSGTAF